MSDTTPPVLRCSGRARHPPIPRDQDVTYALISGMIGSQESLQSASPFGSPTQSQLALENADEANTTSEVPSTPEQEGRAQSALAYI